MIQNCKMRHENGNCLPAGGFCTANNNICKALQNAYEMGQWDVIRKKGEWIYSTNNESVCEEWTCNLCGIFSLENTNFCPNCGADMRGKKNDTND